MRKLFIILICCISFSCSKEEEEDTFLKILFTTGDVRLIDYYAVGSNDKQLLWSEEFDNNDSKWPDEAGDYDDASVKVENGHLMVDFFANDSFPGWYRYFFIPVEMPDNRINFEVEMKLVMDRDKYRKFRPCIAALHENKDSIRYVLNYKGDYYFEVTDRYSPDYLTLSKETGGNWETVIEYRGNENLKPDQFNTLTIRKISNKYAIFINHKLFYVFEDSDFNYNPSILFQRGRVNVYDYFRVYHLR